MASIPIANTSFGPRRTKDALFLRLRWNIYRDLNEIEVEDGLDENGMEKRNPLLSHPIADESIAEPPLSSVHVSCMDIGDVVLYNTRDDYQYNGFFIEKADGSPITMRDVVTKVHEHLNEPTHRQILRYSKKHARPITNPYAPPPDHNLDPDIYVKRVNGITSGDRAALSVTTWVLGEYGYESVEEFNCRKRENRLPGP